MATRHSLRFIDMFAGLGGFHIGLTQLGHRCVCACESNEGLRDLYEENFGLRPHHEIRKLRSDRIPAHDILCAGFPCQPFSKAGEQLGLDCTRDGDLFHHLLRIIRYHRPNYLVLENVANLERHHGGITYKGMRGQLKRLGYDVDQRVLSPHSFGIPQRRDRLFIVAALSSLDGFEWPIANDETPSVFDVLDDNPKDAKLVPEHYRRCLAAWQEFLDRFPRDQQLPSFPIWSMEFGANYPYETTTPAELSSRQLAGYRGAHGRPLRELPPDERMDGLPRYARAPVFPKWKQQFIRSNRQFYTAHRRWIDAWLSRILEFPSSLQKLEWNCKGERRNLEEHILQFRASGVRVKRSTTAPALIAMTTTQVPIIAREGRYMTVRECSRLQGMGDLEHLPQSPTPAYRALGNAVNADLVELVCENLVHRVQKTVAVPAMDAACF